MEDQHRDTPWPPVPLSSFSSGLDCKGPCLPPSAPHRRSAAPQAPAGQLGRWSHTAIRFGYGTLDDGKTSELEIFVDGESLCGVKFPALPEASMHMR